MRGSPFIAALGEAATSWEDKLVSMQDIMDVWMSVQSTWMYLEPIFSSEDIMRQMPVEGRNFKAVDRTWRKIMDNTCKDHRVIQSTDYPNLLDIMRKAFQDLEGVQKGLNTYLEKKRLFFARFFFLSNDELLEILSETKDPLRVQPHLKKCFEGVSGRSCWMTEWNAERFIGGFCFTDLLTGIWPEYRDNGYDIGRRWIGTDNEEDLPECGKCMMCYIICWNGVIPLSNFDAFWVIGFGRKMVEGSSNCYDRERIESDKIGVWQLLVNATT